MKKSFTLVFLLAALAATAQITIESGDIAPLWTQAFQATDTMPDASIQAGSTGQQTWDFSLLKADEVDTIVFVSPASTPYESEFPGATLAFEQGDGSWLYLQNDEEGLRALGFYGAFEVDSATTFELAVKPEPYVGLLRYPVSLNDNYMETYRTNIQFSGELFGADSVRFESTIHRSVKIDAFGEMTTPSGTYQVLRSNEVEVSFDTTYVKFFGFWVEVDASEVGDTSQSYNWWTNESGFGFPVAQLSIVPDSLGGNSATWLLELNTAAHEKTPAISFTAYPNPATDWLTIEMAEPLKGTLSVIDFNGRLVASQPLQNTVEKVKMQGLPAGVYLVVLKDEKGALRGFKQVVKG